MISPANVKLLEAKLMAEYFEVLTASDGPTALEVATQEMPDLVLLDVMMPGMDGFEVCTRLKSSPETSHIPRGHGDCAQRRQRPRARARSRRG